MPVFDGFRNVKQTTLLDRTADFALRPSACRGDVATVAPTDRTRMAYSGRNLATA